MPIEYSSGELLRLFKLIYNNRGALRGIFYSTVCYHDITFDDSHYQKMEKDSEQYMRATIDFLLDTGDRFKAFKVENTPCYSTVGSNKGAGFYLKLAPNFNVLYKRLCQHGTIPMESDAEEEIVSDDKFTTHNDDYTEITICGKDVTLGDPQARLLKYLHKEYLKGNKEYIDTELVLKEAGRKDSRMSDILKKIVDVKDLLFEFTDRFRKVRFNVKHTPPTKRPRIQIKKIN